MPCMTISFQPFKAVTLHGKRLTPAHIQSVRRGAPKSRLIVARSMEVGVGMFGTKAGMTQLFTDEGDAIPVTIIVMEAGNIVTQVKTVETHGYSAVQVGYKVTRESKIKKPELGHLQKAGAPPLKRLREFRVKDVRGFEPGQQLHLDQLFKVGDLVDVAGTTIGKGFQGTVKRWGFSRGPMSHGSKSHRAPGSIGQSATPSRVFPGKKMAGHMGACRRKQRKLEVVFLNLIDNAIVVKGSVPGKPGNILEITPAKILGKNC